MNLLDATTILIESAKNFCPVEDPEILRAVKRMEKRLEVLQYRAAKRKKQVRMSAFWDAFGEFGGGKSVARNAAVIVCKGCQSEIDFGDFLKHAEWDGIGRVKSLNCAQCGLLMMKGIK
jgi:hypothetical protein